MAAAAPAALTPRKKPRQARSAATPEAIFEANIQVLLADVRVFRSPYSARNFAVIEILATASSTLLV